MEHFSSTIKNILDFFNAPVILFPLTILFLMVSSQSLIMIVKKKRDTIWILRWADDICYVNRQWVYTLCSFIGWVPIYCWGNIFRVWLSITTYKILALFLSIPAVIAISLYFMNLLKYNLQSRYEFDCRIHNIRIKKYSLYDIYSWCVFLIGNGFTITCFVKDIIWSQLIEQWRLITLLIYCLWAAYFVFGALGVCVPKVEKLILKIGFDGFHRSKKRNIK